LDCTREAVGWAVATVIPGAGVAAISKLTTPGCDDWAGRQPEMKRTNVMAKRMGIFMIPAFLRSAMPGDPQCGAPVFPSGVPLPHVR